MLNAPVFVHGLAFWSPAWPSWPLAAAALRGETDTNAAAPSSARRPSPTLLSANERRRAPDSVLMALQVAQEACAAAGADPSLLASVFCTAHGDLAIVDALCRSLAQDPLLLSPTRFHHSVHNAGSGYWAIGSRNRQASTAVAAGTHSFAGGLLEAISQCLADQRDILLVACDTEAVGPLHCVSPSRGLLALALVLGPAARGSAQAPSRHRLAWALVPGAQQPPALKSAAARSLQDNTMAAALPLFETLAGDAPAQLVLPLSGTLGLALAVDVDAPGARSGSRRPLRA